MRKFIFLIMILFLNGCGTVIKIKNFPTSGKNVVMFGNSAQREFFIPIDITDSLSLIWTDDTKGSHDYTSVTTVSEFLFIGDLAGILSCYNRKTGKLMGEVKHEGEIPAAPVLSDYRAAYVVNNFKERFSTLVIYDYILGKIRFEIELPGKFTNELILENDFIYLLSEKGTLYKYDLLGNQIWKFESSDISISIPAVYNDQILFANIKGEVLSVNKNSGELIFKEKISNSFESGFSVSGGFAFIGDTEGRLFCLDIMNRKIEWQFDTGAKIKALAVFDNKNVYAGNLAGGFFALAKDSGNLLWKIKTKGLLNITPLVFNNFIVLPDQAQKVHFIDKQNGQITKSMNFESRVKLSPVYTDNTLFLGEDRGNIYAYKFVE